MTVFYQHRSVFVDICDFEDQITFHNRFMQKTNKLKKSSLTFFLAATILSFISLPLNCYNEFALLIRKISCAVFDICRFLVVLILGTV